MLLVIQIGDCMSKKQFHQQRLQILHMGVHFNEFSISYLYAWAESLYPVTFDTDDSVECRPHEVYEDEFMISKGQVNSIISYCADRWESKSLPTFDEVASQFPLMSETGIINVFRYLYLEDFFDDSFWAALLEKGQYPGRAASIKIEPDRSTLIQYLGY